MALYVTIVDIVIPNNAWWIDSIQFGITGDTSWSFSNQAFLMDIAASAVGTPVLSLSSVGGTIVVDDVVNRILHFNVTDKQIRTSLPVGTYVYDLIMVDNPTGTRNVLCSGTIVVTQGVTIED